MRLHMSVFSMFPLESRSRIKRLAIELHRLTANSANLLHCSYQFHQSHACHWLCNIVMGIIPAIDLGRLDIIEGW